MYDRIWVNHLALTILAEISSVTGQKFDQVKTEDAAAKIASILGIAINETRLRASREQDRAFAALLSAIVEAAGGEVVVEKKVLDAPRPFKRVKRFGGKVLFRSVSGTRRALL